MNNVSRTRLMAVVRVVQGACMFVLVGTLVSRDASLGIHTLSPHVHAAHATL